MTIGISAYDLTATDALDLAIAADGAGFDAVWLGEHVVSLAHETPYPSISDTYRTVKTDVISADVSLLDPWTMLAAIAATTTRIRVATGVYLLPMRHPLVSARAASTLYDLSAGRFNLGVAAGWVREEFDALDVSFADRGERTDEAIEILRLAQGGGLFSHHGKHYQLDQVQISKHATPYPIVVGGGSPAALRRAARSADGWLSAGQPPLADLLTFRDRLSTARARYNRTNDFRIYARVEDLDAELAEQYRREGVEDLVVPASRVWPSGVPLELKRQRLQAFARALGLGGA